ncbi:MAG: hypothetical protein LBO81_00415, partial [Clostridiales Family XIII bacterium]|nr:hypothetical protein [Clostridiales Family XIII bacterium]
RSITIHVGNGTKVFGATDPMPLASYRINGLGDLPIGAVTLTREEGDAIGNYRIDARVTGNTDNYRLTVIKGTFTIVAVPMAPITPIHIAPITGASVSADGGGSMSFAVVPAPLAPSLTTDVTSDPTPATDATEVTGKPKGETFLDSGRTPLASNGAWALLNLIFTLVTIVVSILLVATYRARRMDGRGTAAGVVGKRPAMRLIGILAMVASIVLFIRTEDISMPMQYWDRHTLLHVLIAGAQIFVAVLSGKRHERNADDENEF